MLHHSYWGEVFGGILFSPTWTYCTLASPKAKNWTFPLFSVCSLAHLLCVYIVFEENIVFLSNQFAIPLTESLPRLAFFADKRFSSCYKLAQHWRHLSKLTVIQLNLLCILLVILSRLTPCYVIRQTIWIPDILDHKTDILVRTIQILNLSNILKKNCIRMVLIIRKLNRNFGRLKCI